MMYRISLSLLVFVLLAGGRANAQTPSATPAFKFPPTLDLRDVWIHLERRSPSFTLTVLGDGTVVYHGGRGVKTLGERRAKVPVKSVIDFLNFAAEQGIFALEPDAFGFTTRLLLQPNGEVLHAFTTVPSPDNAYSTLQIKLEERQVWLNYDGRTGWLIVLERRLEQLAGATSWVK